MDRAHANGAVHCTARQLCAAFYGTNFSGTRKRLVEGRATRREVPQRGRWRDNLQHGGVVLERAREHAARADGPHAHAAVQRAGQQQQQTPRAAVGGAAGAVGLGLWR